MSNSARQTLVKRMLESNRRGVMPTPLWAAEKIADVLLGIVEYDDELDGPLMIGEIACLELHYGDYEPWFEFCPTSASPNSPWLWASGEKDGTDRDGTCKDDAEMADEIRRWYLGYNDD